MKISKCTDGWAKVAAYKAGKDSKVLSICIEPDTANYSNCSWDDRCRMFDDRTNAITKVFLKRQMTDDDRIMDVFYEALCDRLTEEGIDGLMGGCHSDAYCIHIYEPGNDNYKNVKDIVYDFVDEVNKLPGTQLIIRDDEVRITNIKKPKNEDMGEDANGNKFELGDSIVAIIENRPIFTKIVGLSGKTIQTLTGRNVDPAKVLVVQKADGSSAKMVE